MITRLSGPQQMYLYKNTIQSSARLNLARNTEDVDVQKAILGKGNPRELVALASNEHLDDVVLQKLVELSEKYRGIAMALLEKK